MIELNKLLKKYDEHLHPVELPDDSPKPILFPDDVYDEICVKLDIKELGLIGIS